MRSKRKWGSRASCLVYQPCGKAHRFAVGSLSRRSIQLSNVKKHAPGNSWIFKENYCPPLTIDQWGTIIILKNRVIRVGVCLFEHYGVVSVVGPGTLKDLACRVDTAAFSKGLETARAED